MTIDNEHDALIEADAHDLHGLYLTVPGLLSLASNGRIAGLVSPRAQFIGIGMDVQDARAGFRRIQKLIAIGRDIAEPCAQNEDYICCR